MYISQHLSINFGAKILSVQTEDHNCQTEWQFLAMQKGAVTIFLPETGEKTMLQQEDVLLLPPNCSYVCKPYSQNILLGVQIDDNFFSTLLEPNQSFFCDSTKGPKSHYHSLYQLLTRICAAFYTEDNHYRMLSLIFELADTMKRNFIQSGDTTSMSNSELLVQKRLSAIEHFLQTSYHQPVSLELLADQMFLSPQYLSKFIKKHLGRTFSHYLAGIRLEHAHTELINTEDSITAIALNNGFPNIAAFNKAFRDNYGSSPSSYRAAYKKLPKRRQDPELLLPLELLEPSPSIREIHVSCKDPEPYAKPWCDAINIGSLVDALKISFHDSFLECQKMIPVTYVRFTDIFSDEIVYRDDQTGEFNFTTLDEVLGFFYHANVIPFVELAYKPRKNHLKPDTPAYWEMIFSPQKEKGYYYKLLSAILGHCIQRFGIQYVSKWRFEFWLRHENNLVYSTNFDTYFDMYLNYREIIKEHVKECLLGGPGFNMCGNMQSFMDFLKEAARRQVPFDFISLYGFSYETQSFSTQDIKDSQGIISSNTSHIHDTFLKYTGYLKTTPYGGLPVFMTEFGSSVALENHVADSVFQAAFLCHNMLQLIPCCQSAAYLSFWDNNKDIAIPSSIYFPGSSLVGENGIPKPALHGYAFLAKLGKRLVSQGENYIMTCNSSNRFQLLFYHYAHYNDSFCLDPWESISMEQTYEIFRQEEPFSFHFTCDNFPPGRYKVVRYSLNRGYGSALDKYLRTLQQGNITSREMISTLMNLKEDESRYYKQTSIPRQDIYYLTSTETLHLDLTLEAHEIAFFEFTRVF